MYIVKVNGSDKLKYKKLLLIADEQMDMIEKYLYCGDMFALCDEDVRAVCVVTQEQAGVYEMKHIATDPKHQRKGYGKMLLSFIINHYRSVGTVIYVGTGDVPDILNFYKKSGFTKSHIVKNFFINNYDHPIYEDGKQLVDMIYLKRVLI